MNKRRTHFYHIITSSSIFQTFDEALFKAEALKRKIVDLCKKMNYCCLCYIAVSVSDPKSARVKVISRGKRIIVTKSRQKSKETNPHLHIVLLANPGETVANEIFQYLRKNEMGIQPTKKVCHTYEHLKNVIPYAIFQSLNFRAFASNVENLPQDMLETFCSLAEKANKEIGGVKPVFQGVSDRYFAGRICDAVNNESEDESSNVLFTNSFSPETTKSLENTEINDIFNEFDKLQCKYKYIYNNINTIKDITDINNLYTSTTISNIFNPSNISMSITPIDYNDSLYHPVIYSYIDLLENNCIYNYTSNPFNSS